MVVEGGVVSKEWSGAYLKCLADVGKVRCEGNSTCQIAGDKALLCGDRVHTVVISNQYQLQLSGEV